MAGGGRPEGALFSKGYFVKPTIFDRAEISMLIAQEEIFGPVLSVLQWRADDEVIDQANGVHYGPRASIWTRDLQGTGGFLCKKFFARF